MEFKLARFVSTLLQEPFNADQKLFLSNGQVGHLEERIDPAFETIQLASKSPGGQELGRHHVLQ